MITPHQMTYPPHVKKFQAQLCGRNNTCNSQQIEERHMHTLTTNLVVLKKKEMWIQEVENIALTVTIVKQFVAENVEEIHK